MEMKIFTFGKIFFMWLNNILETIGDTPLIRLNKITRDLPCTVLAKVEYFNPGNSIKDRMALKMLEVAEQEGKIKPGGTIIEGTSGNTGIALAMIARLKNLYLELVMPDNATKERILTMQAFGAHVILTPADASMEGAIDLARVKVEKEGYVTLDQFGNPHNPQMHYRTTGPEIYRDTKGEVTHFVSAMGTTGTIMGVSRYLKEQNKNIQIIGAQPAEGAKIPGIRKWPEAYMPKIFDRSRVDQIFEVTETEAKNMARRLAKEEGIFSGMSSGGSVATALKVISGLDKGVVVCIICDRGDRYLSTDLFECS
jgi:cysteine synthase B